MGDVAKATNPARLPFNAGVYLRCHPGMWLLPVLMLVAMPILGLATKLSLGISLGMGILFAVLALPMAFSNTKKKMTDGNLCAARVVSTAPYTVAVLADLSNDGSGPKLAVKIAQAPLEQMTGGPPKLGAKLPAVSHYSGEPGSGAWKDFSTLIAQTACSDMNQIKRALDAIDSNDWQILEQAMKSLKPTALGLHHLQV